MSDFHPLEVVSRYRDPQLQVCENYLFLFVQVAVVGQASPNFN